jgi:hypothetical protein
VPQKMDCATGVRLAQSISDHRRRCRVVRTLARAIVSASIMPPKAADDALHVAAAVAGVKYLLTLNCKHIATAHELPRVYRLLDEHGFGQLLHACGIREDDGGVSEDCGGAGEGDVSESLAPIISAEARQRASSSSRAASPSSPARP